MIIIYQTRDFGKIAGEKKGNRLYNLVKSTLYFTLDGTEEEIARFKDRTEYRNYKKAS